MFNVPIMMICVPLCTYVNNCCVARTVEFHIRVGWGARWTRPSRWVALWCTPASSTEAPGGPPQPLPHKNPPMLIYSHITKLRLVLHNRCRSCAVCFILYTFYLFIYILTICLLVLYLFISYYSYYYYYNYYYYYYCTRLLYSITLLLLRYVTLRVIETCFLFDSY